MKRIFCIFMTLTLIFMLFGCEKSRTAANSAGILKAHFLKLDEGKCTVFELPDGKCMLTDCGTADDFPKIYEYVRNLGIDSIDCLAVTYTDSLHMGGAKKVMQNFNVREIYVPEYAVNVTLYKNTVAEAAKMNCAVRELCNGTALKDEKEICISAVSPIENNYSNKNDFAVSLIVSYRENTFFIEGDCSIESENDMISSFGEYMKSDVLSVAESGSDRASSPAFLQNVSPEYAVIQVPKIADKKPSKKVLESLDIIGAQVLRSDINGTVVIKCDGTDISVNTEA